jgi:hypothetical protein
LGVRPQALHSAEAQRTKAFAKSQVNMAPFPGVSVFSFWEDIPVHIFPYQDKHSYTASEKHIVILAYVGQPWAGPQTSRAVSIQPSAIRQA